MEIDSAWYKDVNLYNLTASVTLTISKEEAEIYHKFLLICNYHRKISAKTVEEIYGLDEKIAEKILNILVDEIYILEKEFDNEEVYYKVIKNNLDSINLLKEEKIYYQAPVKFSLCLYPLIISNKFLYWEKIEDFEPSKLMFETLEKIEHIIQSNDQIKSEIGIPNTYCGFNFSKGIKINGIIHCRISQKDNLFNLYQNNYLISKISNLHPDYSILKEEFEMIKMNQNLLKERINQEITLKLHITNFYSEFSENNQEIIIYIEEQDIVNIGDIYRIISNNEGKELPVPIEKDWFYKIKLKFRITNTILNAWINLYKELGFLIKENYSDLINENLSTIIRNLDLILKKINSNNKIEFKPSFDEIKMNLQMIANYSKDEWFQILFAKLLEKEVIL